MTPRASTGPEVAVRRETNRSGTQSIGTPTAGEVVMANVTDILRIKGSLVHGVSPDATVYDAIEKMVAHNVGALVVRDGNHPVGIVTERDYMRRVALDGRTSKTTRVVEIMSMELVAVTPVTSVERCMELM